MLNRARWEREEGGGAKNVRNANVEDLREISRWMWVGKWERECYLQLAIKINLSRRRDGSAESVDASDEAKLIHLEVDTAVLMCLQIAAPVCL